LLNASFIQSVMHAPKAGRLTEVRARELISEIGEQTSDEPLRSYTVEGWLLDWLKVQTGREGRRDVSQVREEH
jgi:hypothetical protein